MRKGYVTKRVAPDGYVAVTKPLAKVLYDKGMQVVLCGNNVNSFHVFGGWCLGCRVTKAEEGEESFCELCRSFTTYLDKELGTYPVFYVQQHAVKEAE